MANAYTQQLLTALITAFTSLFPNQHNSSSLPLFLHTRNAVLTRNDNHLVEQHLKGDAVELPLHDNTPGTPVMSVSAVSLDTQGYLNYKHDVLLGDCQRLINAATAKSIPIYQERYATGSRLYLFTDRTLTPDQMTNSLIGWILEAELVNPGGVKLHTETDTSLTLPYAGAANCPAGLGATHLQTPDGQPIALHEATNINRATYDPQLLLHWISITEAYESPF